MGGRNVVVAIPPAAVVEHYLRTRGADMPEWVADVLRMHPWHLLAGRSGMLDQDLVHRVAKAVHGNGARERDR